MRTTARSSVMFDERNVSRTGIVPYRILMLPGLLRIVSPRISTTPWPYRVVSIRIANAQNHAMMPHRRTKAFAHSSPAPTFPHCYTSLGPRLQWPPASSLLGKTCARFVPGSACRSESSRDRTSDIRPIACEDRAFGGAANTINCRGQAPAGDRGDARNNLRIPHR